MINCPEKPDIQLTIGVTGQSAWFGHMGLIAEHGEPHRDMNMKAKALLLLAVVGVTLGATAATAAGTFQKAQTAAAGQSYWVGVDWDDDDRGVSGAIPVPNAQVLTKAGMVRVEEVERDNGRIEAEGYDQSGRELEILMDGKGQRILSVRHDD